MGLAFTAASSQSLSKASAILTATPLSFECWYNPPNNTGNQTLICIVSTTVTDSFLMDVVSGQLRARTAHSPSSAQILSAATLTTGAWNHCVAVFASATSRVVYLNNVSGSNATSFVPASLTKTSIGAFYNGTTTAINFANGTIAFYAIRNVALSATDVASLFAGASPKLVQPGSLVSYGWLDSASSPVDRVSSTAWTVNGSPTVGSNPRIYAP
jgi:hypothetical protein